MTLIPTTAPQDEVTSNLVTRLRHDVVPAAGAGTDLDVKVTGSAAANIDLTDFLALFLLSRVREEYVRTDDPVESVADGLATTARVITAAAAIMIVVFGSFALEDDRLIKMLGTGLASAVLLDVTLIRMLLVPATMELLGARNWWMPDWLDRIVPRLSVEGSGRHDDAPAPDRPDEPVPQPTPVKMLQPVDV